jgi:hypothetical protein
MDYDEITKNIKKSNKVLNKRSGIFEPHFDLVVELLKRGVRKNQVLEYIKTIDKSIADKKEGTVKSLFSQFVNTKRVLSSMATNIFISTSTNIQTQDIKKRSGKVSKKESDEKREEAVPSIIEERRDEPVVEKTTADSVAKNGKNNQAFPQNDEEARKAIIAAKYAPRA